MEKITLETLKYLLKWKANRKYPSKAKIVLIRNENMEIEHVLNYKSREQYKKEKKNYIYEMLKFYNDFNFSKYDLQEIEHWKI